MSSTHRIRSGSLSWQQVDDEVVVLDLERSTYLSLNGSAAMLWNDLAEHGSDGVSDDDLAAVLVRAYDVPAGRASADVKAFVDDGVRLGLLE